MRPRIGSPLVALVLGASLLFAVWAVIDPGQLNTLAAGVGTLAVLLCLLHIAGLLPARARAGMFRSKLSAGVTAAAADPAGAGTARDLYELPWYAILTADAPPTPVVRAGREAVFVQFNAATPASRELLETLRTLRPHAPIAGAILGIPADRLLTSTPAQNTQTAGALASNLEALCSALRTRFPVTLAITHCDALRGFAPLAAALGQGHLVGWSNPASPESRANFASFDDPILQITADLHRARLSLLTEPGATPLTRAEDLFALPDKVGRLAVPLRAYAAALEPIRLKNTRPGYFFRGLYLTSGSSFLQQLLGQRLLPERRLVCPARRMARVRRPIGAIAAAALLAPVLSLSLTFVLRTSSLGSLAFGISAAAPQAIRRDPARSAHPSPPSASAAHARTPGCRWIASISDSTSRAARSALNASRSALAAIGRVREQFPRFLAAELSTPEAVLAHAQLLVSPDLALPTLPELPCTAPPSIAGPFSPGVARQMFTDYAMLAAALPPGEREPLTTAYSSYAAEYVRLWSARAQPSVAPATWPQLRAALAAMKPAQVNRDTRNLHSVADAALALVPNELGQDEPISAARAAMARDNAALDRPWFDEACRRTRDKWAALDPESARSAIIRLSRARFEADYLEVYAEPPGSRYWCSLVLAALTSIADSSAPRADAAEFIQNTRAFPLCSSSSRTLEPRDLAAARDFTAGIIRTGLTTTAPDDSLPISRGTRTDYPRINNQLARLVGDTAFDDDARDQWAYRLRAVLAFLDEPQVCQLVLFGPSQQVPIDGAIPAAVLIPQFDLTLDSDPPLGPFFTDRPADAGIAFNLPGPSLKFTFRDATGPAATIDVPGPWNVLTLLHQPGASIDDSTDPSGRLVRAPLVFTDAAGRRLCYWIGLRFQRPPPALTQWPSDADWPE